MPLMLCGHSKPELAILLSSQGKSQFRSAAERRAHAHIDTRAVFQMVPAVLGEQALWVLIHAKHFISQFIYIVFIKSIKNRSFILKDFPLLLTHPVTLQ